VELKSIQVKNLFALLIYKDFEDEYKDEVKRWNIKTIV